MAEPEEILAAIEGYFAESSLLSGRRALVTSGPTHEPIDPVRFIANRSSGRQGHAIAEALAGFGAETTLVSGPTDLPDVNRVEVRHVETAEEMLRACQEALPVDVAVCSAAVADWRVKRPATQKLKKDNADAPHLEMTRNPDILATLSQTGDKRPGLVVGFAAETEDVVENARTKLSKKGCDWILANDVSPGTSTFGGERNRIHFLRGEETESWPEMSKQEVARRLAREIADALAKRMDS